MAEWKDEIRKRLGGLSLSPARESEIVEELAQHLEDRYREMLAVSSSDRETRAAVTSELDESLARELRRVERMVSKEPVVAGGGGGNIVNGLLQDLRYGVRVLFKDRGFTTIALLMLALGIGANTAIFQLIDAVRLRSLPVRDPQELAYVRITDMHGARGNISSSHPAVTNAIWEQIRDNQQAFSGVFAWNGTDFNLASSGEARYAAGLWVSGDFFSVLGVRPILGRVFAGTDDRPGCGNPGAVISYSFWQREFGGDPSVIGRQLTLDFQPVEIIGVTPASFYGLEVGRNFDVALPICAEPVIEGARSRLASGTNWWLSVMGRLKPGWTHERASAHLAAISPGIFRTTLPPNYPAVSVKNYLGFKLAAFPGMTGLSRLREDYSTSLYLLLGIAGLVLLIACANLANLMLARASARGREIAIRLALGSSRRRLIQQLMIESLLLAGAGAVLGVLIAGRLSRVLVAMLDTQGNSTFIDLAMDWRVLAFAALLAAATCTVFGLTPALSCTRTAPSEILKATGRGTTADRRRLRLRQALVVLQVALSMVLVVQALLFSRNLKHLMGIDPGFEENGILIAGIDFSRQGIPVERRSEFKEELVSRLRKVPGVQGAAASLFVPLSGDSRGNTVRMDRSSADAGSTSLINTVSDGYFSTVKTPMLVGRDFNESDSPASPKVAIVNEEFSRKLAGGSNPVGKRLWIEPTPGNPATLCEIVGLVKNSKYLYLNEDFYPIVFLPQSQDPQPGQSDLLLIRSGASMAGLTGPVKDAISQVAPQSVIDFAVLKTQILDSLLAERLLAVLSGFFGLLALLLACLGLYGIVSYGVANRSGEIGIRLALGSTRRGIVLMIMRENTVLLLIGLVFGLGLTFASGRVARSLLSGLSATDPLVLVVSVAALVATGLIAALVPARRAGGVDPMTALRHE